MKSQNNTTVGKTPTMSTDAQVTGSTKYNLRLKQPDYWNTPNPEMEEKLLVHWRQTGLAESLSNARKDGEVFWLLDGPPYANGDAHLGHLLNKTLKDVNARYQNLVGRRVLWRAGWDCHGLPLEMAVEKRHGPASKENKPAFLAACREEALLWQKTQAKTMQRLGLQSNFEQPWLTMDPAREASSLDFLRQLWSAGLLVERNSPVHWCPACQSALAASELEKSEKTRLEAYFVSQLTSKSAAAVKGVFGTGLAGEEVYVMSWTTTPWTVFANAAFAYPTSGAVTLVTLSTGQQALMAVAARDKFVMEYPSLVRDAGRTNDGLMQFEQLQRLQLEAVSPLSGRPAPLLPATFASDTDGAGFVHVAPAFGPDDFSLHENNNVSLVCHVGTNGRLHTVQGDVYGTLPEELAGATLDQASVASVELLEKKGLLVHTCEKVVETQNCWRHKKPVFYRASQQWALDLHKPFYGCEQGLAARAMTALEQTQFVPDARAKEPLKTMLATRRYWTLSRDRLWGLPLPFFRHCETNELHPDTDRFWAALCEKVAVEGVEAWTAFPTPPGYTKSTQVVDVWFDSGSAWHSASEDCGDVPDLGVEGRDQTRGWFLSSFLLHAFKNEKPAFKALMTHSFVVGENGLKLSKSSGGGGAALDPATVFKKDGADAFRLWVCAQNVGDEARWGKTALKQASQDLKDWRSFMRYLLANMSDTALDTPPTDLRPMDRLAMAKAHTAASAWSSNMAVGKFNLAMQELNAFRLWASTEWFELNKRMLYCAKDRAPDLLSMQWALNKTFQLFTSMLSVVMPFSAEEAYLAWPGRKHTTVFQAVFDNPAYSSEAATVATLKEGLAWRKLLLPSVEKARAYVEKGTPLAMSFASEKLPGDVDEARLRDWFGTCYVSVELGEEAFLQSDYVPDTGVRLGSLKAAYKPFRCDRCRSYYKVALAPGELCEQCTAET